MDTYEAIKTRRSTRAFSGEPIEKEKLETVLEAGRYAPSGGNSQSTHFLVIKNEKILQDLAQIVKEEFAKMEAGPDTYRSLANAINASKAGNYTFHYNAPVLVVTANDKDYGNNLADCAVAVENMMIMANELDLGSVWINQLKWLNENERVIKFLKDLGLGDNERVYASVALGYADTDDNLPVRKPLKRTGNKVTIIE